MGDNQLFCLRWNNFQAYITSQFESLKNDLDFVDVTLACDGQQLGAHKVVLSACSPFFKELFKTNPCPHPIIFMRDVEVRNVIALLEFMYAGEVNVAQNHLEGFLRTAESLQIKGLTGASKNQKENIDHFAESQPNSAQCFSISPRLINQNSAAYQKKSSNIPSTRDSCTEEIIPSDNVNLSPLPAKKFCRTDENNRLDNDFENEKIESFNSDQKLNPQIQPMQSNKNYSEIERSTNLIEPKIELPDYFEEATNHNVSGYMESNVSNFFGNISVMPLPVVHSYSQSDSESENSVREQEKQVPIKRKRQFFSWIFVKKFDNVIQAQEVLSKENTWSVHYSNESEEGKKTYYRCNKVKKRGSQCSAKRYLLYDSTSDAVLLYQTEADHDHEAKISSQHGLPEAVKLEINKLFDLRMNPRDIMAALTKIEGIQVPKMTQLRNYLSDRRRTIYGKKEKRGRPSKAKSALFMQEVLSKTE